MIHLTLFLRALAIVTVTSAQIVFVARGQAWWMLLTGGLISWLWVENTRLAVRWDVPWTREAYAAGAAAGTWVGWLAASWIGARF